MAFGGLALGSLILYLKGMRTTMFQLSGFYYIGGTITLYIPKVKIQFPRMLFRVQGPQDK